MPDYVIRTFHADGNLYYDGARQDIFLVAGQRQTLAQWQARGWDKAGAWQPQQPDRANASAGA